MLAQRHSCNLKLAQNLSRRPLFIAALSLLLSPRTMFLWWRKGAESARPASAGKSIEDMTRLTSQREGDRPLARPSSVSRARYSKVLDAEEKRLKAELVRAEYQATQDRGNESATSLNNLVRDRREEAKRERAEANERARQLRMSVAADGATARQQVAARNELSRLRKMEFAKESRERVQSSASSLAEGRDALRKSKAEEQRRKATKVYAEMQGRQARAAKQAAQTERELEEKRERVARIRGETDPRGAILENGAVRAEQETSGRQDTSGREGVGAADGARTADAEIGDAGEAR